MHLDRSTQARPRARSRRWNVSLALVLGLSLGLNAIPLWWGLPSGSGWAVDEILPSDVLRATEHLLDGWANRYPPLHYYLLGSIWRPLLELLHGVGVVASAGELRYWLFLLGRSLSVLLATATVYLVYRTARMTFDRPTSTLAALSCAVVAPFVYYAKTMNLEAPYLFWFVFSLWFLVRVLRRHKLGDTLALGATTAFAICSKDQAFALYLGVPPLLVWSHWRRRRAELSPAPFWRSVFHPHLLAGGLVAVALFTLIHRVPFDPRALPRHVAFMRGISAPAAEFSNTVSGHALMLAQSLWNTAFALSLPLLVVCLVGVVWSLRRVPGSWRDPGLLLMVASYYVGFVCLVRYSYDRFFLPVAILLALFGAPVLRALGRWSVRGRPAGRAIVLAILGFAGLRAVAVDLAMLGDSRYAAERWLATEVPPGARAVAVGRNRKIHPRGLETVGWAAVQRQAPGARHDLDADYLVVIVPDWQQPRERRIYDDLVAGRLGYRTAVHLMPGPWWRLLDRSRARTNLDKVDPEITIFRRQEAR